MRGEDDSGRGDAAAKAKARSEISRGRLPRDVKADVKAWQRRLEVFIERGKAIV
jgi:hypothetical protein